MMLTVKRAASMLIALQLGAGASIVYADEVQSAKEAIQQKIYEISGKDSATIQFPVGSSKLSASSEAELKTMLNAVRDNATVKEIVVVAYSDLPYPAEQKSDLPKASRTLAERRAEAVKKKLKDFGAKDIKLFNMASKANWFERTLVTSDAQVKREASEKPGNATHDDIFFEALGKRLKSDGGPRNVVVVIRHNNNN